MPHLQGGAAAIVGPAGSGVNERAIAWECPREVTFGDNRAMRYESRRKPRECPRCGSDRIAVILYGLPDFSEGLKRDLDAGHIVLGGCCVTGSDPAWQCTRCATRIHRQRVRREAG